MDLAFLRIDDQIHGGARAPFAFPDGSVSDLVLTPTGWARRVVRPA
jgi:prepilin-type processing-associated H-X9-DG protein